MSKHRRPMGILSAVFVLGLSGPVIGGPTPLGDVVQPSSEQRADSPTAKDALWFLQEVLPLLEPRASESGAEAEASPFRPPGHGGTPPGQGGTPPGQTTPPGHGGTPPGQAGTAPGQGGGPPPGHRNKR